MTPYKSHSDSATVLQYHYIPKYHPEKQSIPYPMEDSPAGIIAKT